MNRARVHISRVKQYAVDKIRRELEDGLSAIGGLPVKNGDRVILKPNLLAPKTPDKGVTTHPAVVQAVVELVLDSGGIPVIGDSPGVGFSSSVWQPTGLYEISRKYGLKLVDFTSARTIESEVRGNVYYLAEYPLECDLLINLPKLKTHSLTLFTGAVKNMYGCMPGFQKSNWHRRAPKPDQFSQVVVDIYSRFRPRINIMDGILAMEGEGPSNGKPRKVGLIFVSNDAPALDKVASSIIGFQPEEILTTVYADARGLSLGIDEIALSGVDPASVAVPGFELPSDRYLRMIPRLAHSVLGRFIWSRPEVDREKCDACYQCVEYCPAKAMSINSGPPVIDHKTCIECYCCDEVCPQGAIKKKMSWLAKRLV